MKDYVQPGDRTILVVEDEYLIRMDLVIQLEELGFRAVEAATLFAAQNVVRDETLDAAILDVRLPDGEVFPVARQLCELEVPFLFHSAHVRGDDLPGCFDGVPIVPKPSSETRFRAALRGLLPDAGV